MDDQPKDPNSNLSISSTAFKENEEIPRQYSCKGENTNPPLTITGAPADTKSLALIMHDPDAPSGDYVHWLAWDMPANTASINANSVPVGAIQGVNSNSQNRYMGPCPPSGTHHYIFELYALNKTLGLDSSTDRDHLKEAMSGHVLTEAKLTGLFSAN